MLESATTPGKELRRRVPTIVVASTPHPAAAPLCQARGKEQRGRGGAASGGRCGEGRGRRGGARRWKGGEAAEWKRGEGAAAAGEERRGRRRWEAVGLGLGAYISPADVGPNGSRLGGPTGPIGLGREECWQQRKILSK
jgi:hypothetical protein